MSNLETLLTAWLNDGEVPAGFQPETRIEEYLVAILDGVDDSVTPESRADVLLDAIATKYAGYADGLEELRGVSGMTAHHVPGGDTPEEVAAFLRAINTAALQDLSAKGATGVSDNTTDILWAYRDLPSGGGVQYSSIEYDAATETYTLTEKDDPTITHTLTCTYDAQGRINGMVYDSKAIAVEYNNDGTVTVGGTVVDVSEYRSSGTTVYDLPDNDSTVGISTLSTIADITGENCAVAIVALDTTSYSTTNKVNPTVAQLVYRTATLSGVSDSQAYQIVTRGDYHGYIFGSTDDGCLIFTTPRANNAGLLGYPFLAILNMSGGNFTTCSVCAFGG